MKTNAPDNFDELTLEEKILVYSKEVVPRGVEGIVPSASGAKPYTDIVFRHKVRCQNWQLKSEGWKITRQEIFEQEEDL